MLLQFGLILDSAQQEHAALQVVVDTLAHPCADEYVLLVLPDLFFDLGVLLNQLTEPLDALVVLQVLDSLALVKDGVGEDQSSLLHVLPQDLFRILGMPT